MTADETRARLIDTLDDVLLSFRRQLDDADPTAAVPMMSMMKAAALGIAPSRYDRGVIFGLDICTLNDVISYGYGGMQTPGGWTLPGGVFPWDHVVTAGTLHDGTKLVNLWGTDGTPYVHRLLLPTTLRGANFYTMGAVVYDTTSNTFSTRLLGGNNPPVTIEKDDVTLADIERAALREDPADADFKVQPTAVEVLIGRFLADVESATEDGIRFTLHTSVAPRRFPLPSGLPCEAYADLAVLVQSQLSLTDQASYDTTTVYGIMLEICDAATWGTSFYDYWTAPGRTLPDNVKYYYNALFSPPIP